MFELRSEKKERTTREKHNEMEEELLAEGTRKQSGSLGELKTVNMPVAQKVRQ